MTRKKTPSDGEYEVGKGRPPKKNQFKKGEPSPNPSGRPTSQREVPSAGLTDIENAILQAGKKLIGARLAGKSVEVRLHDAIHQKLFAMALEGHLGALKKVIDLTQKIQVKKSAFDREMLEAAVAYISEWGPRFDSCIRRGIALPSQLPDPRDIFVLPNGTVEILGPVTTEHLQTTIEIQKLIRPKVEALNYILNLAPLKDMESGLQSLIRARTREIVKFNSVLPPRMQIWPRPPFVMTVKMRRIAKN